jgi:rhamnosyltransferase
VVVPTLDGGKCFEQCLAALSRQRPSVDALVVIDSGSIDGSDQAAVRAGAHVISINPAEFNHGLTRNQGAFALADVDVIVFLVQDAVLEGDESLEFLAQGALAEGVGAVTARQLPPLDASPLTRATVERSPMASAEPRRVGPLSAEELTAYGPQDWRAQLLLDDVACAVRGALFRQSGFRQAVFGEDALLAFDLLWGGWSLAHEPRAVVRHGHEYDASTVGQRYLADARFFRECFGLALRPGLWGLAKGFLAQLLADRRWMLAHRDVAQPGLLLRSASLRWAQVLAQWKGSRGPAGGPPERRQLPRPGELAA